ncbi:MAG: InlB B-repeat-containing protein, partial [Clostridiaceae bacterium]|nr:InlB B-repeat-containing protein [Clostridiaceae bacterium]
MKKRIFGLLLSLCLVMALVPNLAMADGDTVTVSFDMKDHGTGAPVNQTIPKGTPAVEPEDPVPLPEEKFYFGYWTYIRNYFVTRWDFSNNVNDDMTLSALWFPWET